MKNRIIILYLLLISTSCAFAQEVVLRGKITDPEGRELTKATVGLGLRRVLSTNEGFYEFKQAALGTVILEVSCIGFKTRIDTIKLTHTINTYDVVLEKKDTNLENVLVTRQRKGNSNAESLIKIENSIMPVTIIDRRTIQLMGSRRLDEVVKEQTGVAIVNDVGSGSRSVGVQMQGFGSEYVLVLIDGQPMVGRNGGSFDLSRISVSNVERIEITKGAASLLYGGDALGGTINVITRHNITAPQLYGTVNYGTNNTLDLSVDGEAPILKNKGSLALNTNYYHTDGFNTDQGNIKGTTAPPYDSYGAQARFRYRFNPHNLLSVMGRGSMRRSFMNKDFGVNFQTQDVLDEYDINLSTNFEHIFNTRWKSMTRYYLTRYNADMSVTLSQGDSLNQTNFGQILHRLEQQVSYSLENNLDVISGVGGTLETIDQNILNNQNSITSYFAYSQANWQLFNHLEVSGGLRYDYIAKYGWRLDPSMALKYKILPVLTFKAAYGTAFKAPDMRKMYQVSYNPAHNNMMVGSMVLRNTINEMMEKGQLSQYELEPVYNEIKGLTLNAEMSKSYNFSLIFETLNKKIRTEVSAFYHDISNQINPVLVGQDIQGNLIYSYRNNAKAYYKGTEFSLSYVPVPNLQFSTGYQYLIAKDKTVGDEIREGGKYYAPLFDPIGGTVNYNPTAADYWGIENRSRHMFNTRVFYTYQPWDASVNFRLNFRGKSPFSDKNANGYMDRYDTFVRDHYLVHAGLEKKFFEKNMSVRCNVENILNFIDRKVPSQPGRMFFVGVSYNLSDWR
ncbi:TonB-dependent receptor [Sphingobacterium tabacisoli]|uniref:TonB-dependent receptor domain-containing protein n=1 Tax=Sphingobacterium tabacisoli TaxID=2044855 RepID=A0ABW5L5L6_9SPHI|nr:TonB-dependent receptor [Sphingobacterium tabacisoli]